MSQNPYQPPKVADTVAPLPQVPMAVPVDSYPGPWRHGKLLVTYKYAELPDICVVSNQSANGTRLKRNMSWHHPALVLTVFAGVLIYVIVAIVLSKRAKLEIPMVREWILRRRKRIAIAWLIVLSSIAAFIGGVALLGQQLDAGGWLMLASLFLFLGGLIYALIACPLIRPARISDNYVWLKGVHADYLANLPVWSHGFDA